MDLTDSNPLNSGTTSRVLVAETPEKHIHVPREIFLSSPPSAAANSTDTNSPTTCTICLEGVSSTGGHRVCCLRCGHLFGLSCIMQWIASKAKKRRTKEKRAIAKCPQCKQAAKTSDIRVLYATSICAIDPTERLKLRAQLDEEQKMRLRAERELALLRSDFERIKARYEGLRREVDIYRSARILPSYTSEALSARDASISTSATTTTVSHTATFSVCSTGSVAPSTAPSNLLAPPNHTTNTLAQWQPSFTLLGSVDDLDSARVVEVGNGYVYVSAHRHAPTAPSSSLGIWKVHCADIRNREFFALHSAALRDLKLQSNDGSAPGGFLLTASQDKSVCVVAVNSGHVAARYAVDGPAWACEWDTSHPLFFYAAVRHSVYLFDLRRSGQWLAKIDNADSASPPLHSLVHWAGTNAEQPYVATRRHGLLTAACGGTPAAVSFWPMVSSGPLANAVDLSPVSTPSPATQSASPNTAAAVVPSFCGLTPSPLSTLQGNCMSLSHDRHSRYIVASFRTTPTFSAKPSHTVFTLAASEGEPVFTEIRTLYGTSPATFLSRSAVFAVTPGSGHRPAVVVAAGDEESREVCLWDAQTGNALPRLARHTTPVLHCKSGNAEGSEGITVLASLSATQLKLWTVR